MSASLTDCDGKVSHYAHLHDIKQELCVSMGKLEGTEVTNGDMSSECFDRRLLMGLWGKERSAGAPSQASQADGRRGMAPSTGTVPGSSRSSLPTSSTCKGWKHGELPGRGHCCPAFATIPTSLLMQRKSHFKPHWPKYSTGETPLGYWGTHWGDSAAPWVFRASPALMVTAPCAKSTEHCRVKHAQSNANTLLLSHIPKKNKQQLKCQDWKGRDIIVLKYQNQMPERVRFRICLLQLRWKLTI